MRSKRAILLTATVLALALPPMTTQAATTGGAFPKTTTTVWVTHSVLQLSAAQCVLAKRAKQPCSISATETLTTHRDAASASSGCNSYKMNVASYELNGWIEYGVSGRVCWNGSIVWPSGGESCSTLLAPGDIWTTSWCGWNAGWTSKMQIGQNGCLYVYIPWVQHENSLGAFGCDQPGGRVRGDLGFGVGFGWLLTRFGEQLPSRWVAAGPNLDRRTKRERCALASSVRVHSVRGRPGILPCKSSVLLILGKQLNLAPHRDTLMPDTCYVNTVPVRP